MGMKLSYEAFVELIQEDLNWLIRQPRSLERDHISLCLEYLKRPEVYAEIPKPFPGA